MKKLMALALIMSLSNSVFAADQEIGESAAAIEEKAEKNFLFRLEPTSLILGELALDLQFKLSDKITVGPTFGYMKNGEGIFYGTKISNHIFRDDRTDRQSFGLRTAYYFKGMNQSSAFISAFGRQAKNKVTISSNIFSSNVEKGEFDESIGGITGGYQWVFGILNISAGGGIAYYSHPESFTLTDTSTGAKSENELDASNISYTFDAGVGLTF